MNRAFLHLTIAFTLLALPFSSHAADQREPYVHRP